MFFVFDVTFILNLATLDLLGKTFSVKTEKEGKFNDLMKCLSRAEKKAEKFNVIDIKTSFPVVTTTTTLDEIKVFLLQFAGDDNRDGRNKSLRFQRFISSGAGFTVNPLIISQNCADFRCNY